MELMNFILDYTTTFSSVKRGSPTMVVISVCAKMFYFFIYIFGYNVVKLQKKENSTKFSFEK